MATIEEILTWAADGGEIPTEAALHKDLTDRTAGKMNENILGQLQFEYDGALHLWLPIRVGSKVYDESDPDEDFELAIELYRCLKKGENEPDPIVMGIWVQTGSPDDQRRILPMAPVGHIEKVHEDWMARSEPRPEHPLIPLVKAWQKWKVSRGAPLRERHLHVLDNGAKPLARSPGLLNHAVLSDIEAVEVDGLPVATAMASPLIAYRQRRGPKDPQIPLLPYPATLEGEPVGDVIIASMSNYPLTRDERNPLRGDIYRLGSFVFAVTGSTAIPEDLGAHFLTGGVSEAAKRRWWATVETLRAIVLRVNPRTGAFLDLAIASIDRDGTAHLAPPLWWRGKHAWRLTGGLFRPALADNADSERGPDAGYWGGLNRTIAGIEAALAWGPTAGRGRQGRIPDWLKPANGRTGPGPSVFVPWRNVLVLAGEHVAADMPPRNSTEGRRYRRRKDALREAGYFVDGREAPARDTIEIVRATGGPGKKEPPGLLVRATSHHVEAARKAQVGKNWTLIPAERVFER